MTGRGIHKYARAWIVAFCVVYASAAVTAGMTPGCAQSASPATAPETEARVDIWSALAFQDAAALRDLIAAGANVNKPDTLSLMTPLMAADTRPLAAMLVEAGADVNARDRFGHSVLHYAVRARDAAAIIELLVRRGADVNASAGTGTRATPLIAALAAYFEGPDKTRSIRAIRALAAAGADLNYHTTDGPTPLAIAAERNDIVLIKLLLSLGANPAEPLGDGSTVVDQAQARGAFDVVAVLNEALSARRAKN